MTGLCTACNKVVTFDHERCPACGNGLGQQKADRFFGAETEGASATEIELPQGLVLLDRFKVLGRSGTGPTGTAYEMYDAVRSEPVAVKVAPLSAGGPDETVTDLVQAMRLLERVRDFRYILKPFDTHIASWGGGKFFLLTMECADSNLCSWMELHRTNLPIRHEQGLELIRGLCAGLAELEAAGITPLHLDPKDILMVRGIPKVALAVTPALLDGHLVLGTDPATPPRTLGSSGYMSPEQLTARRAKELDVRSCIFSVGVMLYEMLNPDSRRPRDDGQEPSYRAIVASAGASGERLATVLRRCLAPRPEDRFRSAQELLDALNGYDKEPAPKKNDEAPRVERDPSADRTGEAWEAAQAALDNGRYTEGLRLCRGVLALDLTHPGASDVIQELEERQRQAGRLYSAVARDIENQPLTTSAAMVQEAVSIYPDHPDGFFIQQKLIERSAAYSRYVEQGIEALAGESWSIALQCFARAVKITPDEPVLAALVSTLEPFVDAINEGRRRIDSAVAAGEFHQAAALAAALDGHIADVGLTLSEQARRIAS